MKLKESVLRDEWEKGGEKSYAVQEGQTDVCLWFRCLYSEENSFLSKVHNIYKFIHGTTSYILPSLDLLTWNRKMIHFSDLFCDME